MFFILKKCGARAVASGNVQCSCALLGQLNDALANKYKGALMARLAGGPGRLIAGAPAAAGGVVGEGGGGGGVQEHAVAINNADVSAEYVVKLRQELEGYAGERTGGGGSTGGDG